MPEMVWRKLIGQQRVKDMLSAALRSGSLGHAYLFSGDEGTGKFQAAIELAMGLLCGDGASVPCLTCESCRRVLHHAHPDLHFLLPAVLSAEHKKESVLTEEGWEYLGGLARERVEDPYRVVSYDGVPGIPVDMTREVMRAVQRGAVDGPRCVVIVDSVDMMNKESANAMLKTLEEPPAGTVIILLTERLHAALPTIVSRCQVVRLGYLSPEELAEGLAEIYKKDLPGDVRDRAVRYCMGSLGRARALVEEPDSDAEEQARAFWAMCGGRDWLALGEKIDEISARQDPALCSQMLLHVAFLARNSLVRGSGAPEKYILTDRGDSGGEGLAAPAADAILTRCQDTLSAIESHGNTALAFTALALGISEILDGEELKAG